MTNVWVASHACATAMNHDKLLTLARLLDTDLTVLAPRVSRALRSATSNPDRGSSHWPPCASLLAELSAKRLNELGLYVT
jgi:hypothetical protein